MAIVGNSDALGMLATDAARARGLEVIDESMSLGTAATAAEFARALAGVIEDPAVDSVLAIFVPPLSTAGVGAVEAIAAAGARSIKPVVATVVGVGPDGGRSLEPLMRRDAEGVPQPGSVPAFFSVEEAVRAIAAVTGYAQWRAPPDRSASGVLGSRRGARCGAGRDSDGAAAVMSATADRRATTSS